MGVVEPNAVEPNVVEPNAVEPKLGTELPNPNVGLAADPETAPNGNKVGAAGAPAVLEAGTGVTLGCGDGAGAPARDGSNGIMFG